MSKGGKNLSKVHRADGSSWNAAVRSAKSSPSHELSQALTQTISDTVVFRPFVHTLAFPQAFTPENS